MKKFYLIFVLLFAINATSYSQCGVVINSFPYIENFELNNGNWVNGGVADDWAWGAPNKAFIQNAGGGAKCWVTGNLTGSFYNLGERSYIVSPCFDFTNLQYPHVKFKIYWECENQYDGITFQFTTNNGATWTNVGSVYDPINCLNNNWFNQSNINALNTLANPKEGWAGTVLPTNGSCNGGGGSLGWITAQHCMSNLAGMPNVQFRFAFGAGNICNNFDGIAIDDIEIGEAQSNFADFSFNCTGNINEYQFNNLSTPCPNTFSWDFGDPTAGANNLSNAQNPTHTFTNAGTYNVTLTVNGPCNAPSTIIKTITTIALNANITNAACGGNNGAIVALGVNINGLPTYTLQPGGVNNNTGIFSNLGAGIYTISLSDAIGCNSTTTATIVASPTINWAAVAPNNITCNGGNTGSINALANGGTGVLTYHLEPNNLTNINGTFNSLIVGTYTISVTDAVGCSISSIVILSQPAPIIFQSIQHTDLDCFNNSSGTIQATFSGGIGSLTYVITPTGITSNNGNFINIQAGTYTVTATDNSGCTGTVTVTLNQPPEIFLSLIRITQPGCNPNNDGSVEVSASGGVGGFTYSSGGNIYGPNPIVGNLTAGTYTIIAKDNNGCTKSVVANLLNMNAPTFTNVSSTGLKCFGDNTGTISVSATGTAPILQYEVKPNSIVDISGNFSNLTSGIYTLIATDINGCSNTSIVQINTPSQLKFDTLRYVSEKCGINAEAFIYTSVSGGTGAKIYKLYPDNITSMDGIFSNIKHAGTYTVTVSDANNCSAYTSLNIEEKICCDNLIIPNAFSPNNDFHNDEFKILNAQGISIKDFIIYNRYGSIAYKAQNTTYGWDGKTNGLDADIGTYYYFIKYTCISTGKEYLIKGDVTLVR